MLYSRALLFTYSIYNNLDLLVPISQSSHAPPPPSIVAITQSLESKKSAPLYKYIQTAGPLALLVYIELPIALAVLLAKIQNNMDGQSRGLGIR